MPYTKIENKEITHEKAFSLAALIMKYNDMYKYSIIIGGNMVFVVVKDKQPTDWEPGWAE